MKGVGRQLLLRLLLPAGVLLLLALVADRLFPPDLRRYQTVSTEVLANDGRLLRAFPVPGGVWRLSTRVEDVDPLYLKLLIAAEDQRFRHHGGVSFPALLRAALQAVEAGRIVSGGSTLTMQTARLLEPHKRGVVGKLHDILRAWQLERRYSKDQILDMYLTLAPMGGNLEGVRAASWAWFGQEPEHLSLDQALTLIALPQSPARRAAPAHFAALIAARQELARRLDLVAWADPRTPLMRRPMPLLAASFAAGLVHQQPQGARIRTTIDADLQRGMEELVAQQLEGVDPKVGVGLLMVDNQSRAILALVGGRGLGYPGGFLDLTRAIRSPGSALKPFIYGMAFDQGILHPQSVITDAPGRINGLCAAQFRQPVPRRRDRRAGAPAILQRPGGRGAGADRGGSVHRQSARRRSADHFAARSGQSGGGTGG